jgi:hypothetical protein
MLSIMLVLLYQMYEAASEAACGVFRNGRAGGPHFLVSLANTKLYP